MGGRERVHDSILDRAACGGLRDLAVPRPLRRGGGAYHAAEGRALRAAGASVRLCTVGGAIGRAADAFLIGPLTQFLAIPFMTPGAGAQAIGEWYGTGQEGGMALGFSV